MTAPSDNDSPTSARAPATMPESVVQSTTGAVFRSPEGSVVSVNAREALERLAGWPHLVCHRVFLINRLARSARGSGDLRTASLGQPHFDIAELFAFVRPAQAALPTPEGLAAAVLGPSASVEGDVLRDIAAALLAELASKQYQNVRETMQIAATMAASGWPWGRLVIETIKYGEQGRDTPGAGTGLNVWDRLPDWEDHGPEPPPGTAQITPDETDAELARVLGDTAEARPEQHAYARDVSQIFAAKEHAGENHVVLAEAGTGLGKTLGYLAPAELWASRNKASVWASTYTKNLQRQLEQETARIYPDPQTRAEKVVIRKGRENYMCLLNFQERIGQLNRSSRTGVALAGLVARWARYSRDGDMVGGDFPAWLIPLFMEGHNPGGQPPSPMALGLTDRRGECIYSACPHYRKCYIERTVRKARRADVVIANHAFVMSQTAVDRALVAVRPPPKSSEDSEKKAPTAQTTTQTSEAGRRLIFDEGHHVFEAADSAFSSHLTGLEAAELRRWIRGSEGSRRRGRGLVERAGDLVADNEAGERFLDAAVSAARELPAPGWMQRIENGAGQNSGERFFALVRQQVHARTEGKNAGFSLETECHPPVENLMSAAEEFLSALKSLAHPLKALSASLHARLDDDADELDTTTRIRIEAMVRSLDRRSQLALSSWQHMLLAIGEQAPDEFADWFSVEMAFGREMDVGMHRHWIDPSQPFAEAVIESCDGVLITSATLRDRPPETPDDWTNAEMRTGASHLATPAKRLSYISPFDYGRQSRLYVVNDVNRDDPRQVAAAMRELFMASNGGALGLFTAIHRLRVAYENLVVPLAEAGLPLFAQHIDPMDTGTLVDLFRADEAACLLGTDAVRDGVDVPGESLRLIVFDRVPWPKPTILERRRREAFGGGRYQDMMTRLKLQQAFGRLIRRQNDRGVFVVLDSRLPTRLTTAFPEAVMINRVGLVDAIEGVRDFLQNDV